MSYLCGGLPWALTLGVCNTLQILLRNRSPIGQLCVSTTGRHSRDYYPLEVHVLESSQEGWSYLTAGFNGFLIVIRPMPSVVLADLDRFLARVHPQFSA